MTRMGLRNFAYLVPAEPPPPPQDRGSHGWRRGEDPDEPSTSYRPPDRNRKTAAAAAAGDCEERVHCSGGTAHMFACFRAGAINMIAHPAMASMGPKRGAAAVQPVSSLPRAAFMEGAAGHHGGDDPTSPVVTCIGQVRVKPAKSAKEGADPSAQRTRRAKLQRSDGPAAEGSAPSSPRPSRWKQFLGSRGGTVNPSLPAAGPAADHEFRIDLSRFSSACSSIAKTAPSSLTDMKGRAHTGAFLAKSLMMLRLECEERDPRPEGAHLPVAGNPADGSAEPLWKRRCGAKPLTLDLQKQST